MYQNFALYNDHSKGVLLKSYNIYSKGRLTTNMATPFCCILAVAPKCFKTLSGESGKIYSLNYPAKNSRSMHCSWTIQVPANKLLKIEFIDSASLSMDCIKVFKII